MVEFSPSAQAQLEQERGSAGMVLVWIVAKNRTTGAAESLGFWTGDDHQTFVIGGESRLYYGAGAVIEVGTVRAVTGLQKRTHRVRLPPMIDEVRTALRGYEARQARVEIHVCPFDLDSGMPLSEPKRMIKGVLQRAPEQLGGQGEQAYTELEIATGVKLTRGVPAYKSSAALQDHAPTDKGREYIDLGEEWTVRWGVVN